MKDTHVIKEKETIQIEGKGLNLVGPTTIYLDTETQRVNVRFAEAFERINSEGAI